MKKSVICPICGERAFSSLLSPALSKVKPRCESCGHEVHHSKVSLVLIQGLGAILFSIGLTLIDLTVLSVLILGFSSFAVIVVLMIFFTPLVPTKRIEITPDNTPIVWYTSPLIWLGVPVVILIIYGIST